MTESLTSTREQLISPELGRGDLVSAAIGEGWVDCRTTTSAVTDAIETYITVDDTAVVPDLDSQRVLEKVSSAVEKELFEWSKAGELAELITDKDPSEWYVLSSGSTHTHVLNFSSRILDTAALERIQSAHQKTSEVTGGASAEATKAIVITEQEFLGYNQHENRPSNGKAHSQSGIVFLSERIFDTDDVSTKEYVRESGALQVEAVLAHEEVHQAQLGRYSPIIKTKQNHLEQFKAASGWTERSYDLPEGKYVIEGIGHVALFGGEIELPISSYGNVNPKEDTAESGAALVIGMNPGNIRSESITQLQQMSAEARPDLANLEFTILERPRDVPLGTSQLDYPAKPITARVIFKQDEGD